jgi:threonine dehydratase
MERQFPVLKDVERARIRIQPYIHLTPVLTSRSINKITGSEIFFKCENFQKVGAFKFRGATNAVFSLSDAEAARGVATHSSGNHAAALALAAQLRGIKYHIVMPDTSPRIKKLAVKGYGAEITYCEPTLESREETLQRVVEKTDAVFIHPFDDVRVISGQGTAALELLEVVDDLDYIIAPVGGGGMICGTATVVHEKKPQIKVIAAEPENADDAYRSFKTGILYPSVNPSTIADGLLTSLSPLTFGIIREKVYDITTASEGQIIEAMRMVWERMKIIIEPSSAVALAIVLSDKERFREKRLGIMLTGGNVDLDHLPF